MKCFLILLTLLSIIVSPVPQTLASGHSEGKWTAHPPIRIQREAQAAPTGYNPAQIRHAYGFDALSSNGAGQTIAIVDAYDAPAIASDLTTFINTYRLTDMFGLPGKQSCTVSVGPHPCFQKVYAGGKKPTTNAGWALETSLDVEWAHVAAPSSDLLLVETTSSSLTPLLAGVDRAVSGGASAVSMSWGGPEFSMESKYDTHFDKTGTVFLAASGDQGTGQSYPASSPYVLSVGGTTLPLDDRGNRAGKEKGWQGSGGGVSAFEAEPEYQSAFGISSNHLRSGPDVSYNADPATGVSVYDSTKYNRKAGWYSIGGTSAAAPQWAGIVALMNTQRSAPLSTNSLQHNFAYDAAAVAGRFRDIRSGSNGPCGAGCKAAAGYDLVTGLGSPIVDHLASQ